MKQNQIAHGCALTVLTDSSVFQHGYAADALIRKAIRRALGSQFGDNPHYDLLTIPNIGRIYEDGELPQVAADVSLALGLHSTEHLIVIKPGPFMLEDIATRLGSDPRLADIGGIHVTHVEPPDPMLSSDTAVIACMDYRQHGPGGFMRRIDELFQAPDGYHLICIPGAAKDIAGSRGPAVIRWLTHLRENWSVERVIIVSHLDCGAYGGTARFNTEGEERNTLARDLVAAVLHLRQYVPQGMYYSLGIAEIDGETTGQIRLVT
ncbi:MAG: hypothetical protein PHT12_01200 [Patescibacteria group bacterium]|nr:hypothetical protein [Patescibacteria group bacterium]